MEDRLPEDYAIPPVRSGWYSFQKSMNVDQILSQLQRDDGHFAKAAVLEAVAHRDEVIPALLNVLRDVANNPETYASDPDNILLTYAMYLLAQFHESRAYPILVQIFSLPDEMPFDLVGDTVTEGLGRILASVSDGDIGGMTSLIENEQANPYVRSAAMDGLLTLIACGKRTREEIVAYFHHLFQKLERTPSEAWDGLACSCTDLWPDELMGDLRSAWEDALISPDMINWDDIEAWHARGKEACVQYMNEKYTLITDVAKEMAWWACFDKHRKGADWEKTARVTEASLTGDLWPIRRTEPKVGRNEPCPCGSGKKFKKCCAG
jgi:Protein of unknown function (DUF1186)/SEC-C motif